MPLSAKLTFIPSNEYFAIFEYDKKIDNTKYNFDAGISYWVTGEGS